MMDKNERYDTAVLISKIKHKKLQTSYEISINTEQLVEKWISEGNWTNTMELMVKIKAAIEQIKAVLEHQIIATNILRHILKMIREEHEADGSKLPGKIEGQSLHQMITADPNDTLDYSKSVSHLKTSLLDNFQEYKVELESSVENIATQSLEYIHSNEIILTVGKSETVLKFLKYAAKKREFQVIVVEGAPKFQGHEMASILSKSNIQTTLISDAAIFATMSRVNEVIIGTHAVLADGGLCASSGVHTIALAAQRYSVPVIVLAHIFKLTPTYVVPNRDDDGFNTFGSPAAIMPPSIGPIVHKIEILNPLYDYVPPELITLFISHHGGNSPSYVYRLLSELYHPDDYDL